MSALLSSITTTASSGGGLIMPAFTTKFSNRITLKTGANSSIYPANVADFWDAIDVDYNASGYQTTKLVAATGQTSNQTIVNVSGAGVLTNVVTPQLNGTGVVTITVTIDGDVKTFVSPSLLSSSRYFIGFFLGYRFLDAAGG